MNCNSTAHMKNAIVFYYIHMIPYILFIACNVNMWPCFVHFCYPKVTLAKLLEEPHQSVLNFHTGSFDQKKTVHCSFRTSGRFNS